MRLPTLADGYPVRPSRHWRQESPGGRDGGGGYSRSIGNTPGAWRRIRRASPRWPSSSWRSTGPSGSLLNTCAASAADGDEASCRNKTGDFAPDCALRGKASPADAVDVGRLTIAIPDDAGANPGDPARLDFRAPRHEAAALLVAAIERAVRRAQGAPGQGRARSIVDTGAGKR